MVNSFTEPLISVGILTDNKVAFELYGEFCTTITAKKLNGRFSAEVING